MAVPHPIPYQGSKRAIARHIVDRFPQDAGRVVEPFAGSAAVSLAAAYYGRVKRFLINDINEPLIALWDQIINHPDELALQYRELWEAQIGRERAFYDSIREQFNKHHDPAYFLYLLARCVKASVRYNPLGEFNQSPDNRRRGAHPVVMKARIKAASLLLKGKTELTCTNFTEVLRHVSAQDIVYMDPPYQGVSIARDKRYISPVAFQVFVNVLEKLNERNIRFIVSYDGQTGDKRYGKELPSSLGLVHLSILAGRSSQATLLGRNHETVESLYLSPNMAGFVADKATNSSSSAPHQYSLFAM